MNDLIIASHIFSMRPRATAIKHEQGGVAEASTTQSNQYEHL